MSTPAAKKRRIDAASATLKKPFRSPLLSRQQQEGSKGSNSTPLRRVQNTSAVDEIADSDDDGLDEDSGDEATPAASPERRHKITKPEKPEPSLVRNGSVSSLRGSTTLRNSRKTDSARLSAGGRASGTAKTGTLSALVSSYERGLAQRAREMRADEEEMRQAELILRGSGKGVGDSQNAEALLDVDADLKELIERWRGAGRIAAEEVFGTVKGRVEATGGVKAWREMRRQQMGFFSGTDDAQAQKDDHGQGSQDGDGDGEDDDRLGEEDGGGKVGQLDDGEDEEFTMLMMLQSLNIDPNLLGWDTIEERWK